MTRAAAGLLLPAALLFHAGAQAGPAAACSGCHAPTPRAGAAIPAIAGRPAGEITAALQAFRDGSRPGTVMGRIARGFTDAEIAAIAAAVSAGP